MYGLSQLGSSPPAFFGAYSHLPPSSAGPSGSIVREQKFPERPGQPDCKYYMRTGDCKYGPSCRYNHMPDWDVAKSNCALSALGLPLRPVWIRPSMCMVFHFVPFIVIIHLFHFYLINVSWGWGLAFVLADWSIFLSYV